MISSTHIKDYCNEDISLIENYDLALSDKDNIWQCHHRLETHDENGNLRETQLTIADLKSANLYLKRPASELIFLTQTEHKSLHSSNRRYSEETKRKMSAAKKGKPTWTKGKHWKLINGKRIYY